MTERERPPDARAKVLRRLGGWQEPALGREVEAVLNGDLFDGCPLEAAGFALVRFSALGTVVIGPDGKCICTAEQGCLNCDKRDGMRCTREQLERLDREAARRRAWQEG